MASVSGHDGSVTFGAGYTTDAHAWRVTDSAASIDRTTFQPAGDSRQRLAGIGNWEGEYRCRQETTANTALTLAGGFYSTNAHALSLEITADDLLTTPFGVDYNTRITGLLSATGSYDCYLDNTVAIPQHGSTDTLTMTVAAGATYVIPIIVLSVEARASADGSDRHTIVGWESDGSFTETATPVIGVVGAAEFIAEGGRKLTGEIYIIRIGITLTAQRDEAEYTFGFVGSGDPAAA